MSAEKRKTKLKMPRSARGRVDMPLLIFILALLCFGLVMVCSASYVTAYYKEGDSFFYFKSQAKMALLGLVGMAVASFVPYRFWRKYTKIIFLFSLVLLALVYTPLGVERDQARRWLGFGGFTFQPSELAKIALIMFLALYISMHYEKMKRFKEGFLLPFAALVAGTLLIMLETHISGAIVYFCIGFALLYVGGTGLKYLGGLIGVGATGFVGMILFTDYATNRIDSWLHPFEQTLTGGFQIVQSLYTIGSGGLLGLGLGQSRQKHLYMPEGHNDYIFSIICEELGFVGAVAVLLLFAVFIWRIFKIAFAVKDRYGSLIAIGIGSHIAIQVLLNVAVVTSLLPSTGIGLPFFSFGGSALVILLGEMGILLSISRHAELDPQPKPVKENVK